MKSCNEIKELLSFYLDNELHENDRKQVVKHLENCSNCKAELERIKDIIEALNEIEDIELPQDFSVNLHQKLEKEHAQMYPKKSVSKAYALKWASALVAGFALLFVGINAGYFGQFINKNNSEVAYINDADINTVDKDKMYNENRNIEMALDIIGTQKDAALSDSQVKNTKQTGTQKVVPKDELVKTRDNNVDQSVQIAQLPDKPKDDVTTFSTSGFDKTEKNLSTQDKTLYISNMTLLVDDIPDWLSKIRTVVEDNGGKIEESSMEDISNQKECVILVSKSNYDQVIDSIEKVGTVKDTEYLDQQTESRMFSTASTGNVENDEETITINVKVVENN